MSKAIPKISKYMTTTPDSIDSEFSVFSAMELMQKNKIRHLPVMKAGKLFGILSDRDIQQLFALSSNDPHKISVGDACSSLPYITKPEALVSEVANEMAAQKLGSAIVVDNGKLVGIFTAVDACQALSDICEMRFHN